MNRPAWLIILLLASCTGALSVSQEQVKQWLSEHPEEKSQIWAATRDSAAYQRQVRERVRAWVVSQEDTEPPTQSPMNDPPSDSQVAACAADTVPCAQPEPVTQWPIQRAFQRGTSSLASQLLDSSQDAQHHIDQDETITEGERETPSTAAASRPQVPTPPWRARVGPQLAEAHVHTPAQEMPETSSVQSTTLDSASLPSHGQFSYTPTPPWRAQAGQQQNPTHVASASRGVTGLDPSVLSAAGPGGGMGTVTHVMRAVAQQSIPLQASGMQQVLSQPPSGTQPVHVGGAGLPDSGVHASMQVCPLQNGMLPEADTILSWMAQFPTANPLWQQEGQADYLYDSTGSKVHWGVL